MAVPAVVSIFPTDLYNVFPVGESIAIVFDTEVDAYSVKESVFLYGPDTDVITGPRLQIGPATQQNRPEDMLNSPGYKGEVAVDYRVLRIDADTLEELDDQLCYGVSQLEKTKVLITPKAPLKEQTLYQLYVGGGVTIGKAVATRSVFDPEPDGGNAGDGLVLSKGSYKGIVDDRIVISIRASGRPGEGYFDWYYESAPLAFKTVRLTSGWYNLGNGVYVSFNGLFEANDVYTIEVRPSELLAETYVIRFSTAGNEAVTLPTSLTTSPLGLIGISASDVTGFEVVKITPANGSSNQSLLTNQIIITFSKDLDSTTVNHESVKLFRKYSDGVGERESVPFGLIVSGNKLYLNIMEH